jgi:hypothetical protein
MVASTLSSGSSASSPYLVNARFDFTWFFASMAVSYAMAGIYLLLGPGPNKMVVVGIYVGFQLLFNMPHNAQTWTLTVLEPNHLQAHRTRYLGSLVVALALLVGTMAVSPTVGWPFLNSLIIYWGYWHLIKQHFGFVRMYEMRRRVFSRLDQNLSRAVMYVGGLSPLVWRIATGSVTLDSGRGTVTVAHPDIPLFGAQVFVAAGVAVTLLYAARQVFLAVTGGNVAWLAVATVFSALLNFVVGLQLVDDLIVGVAVMTVWHDIQYLGLVWFMSRNRARRQDGGKQLVKLAGEGKLLPYAGWLALYALIIVGLRATLPEPWGAFPITAVVVLHYFHDSFIWKISSNPHLREELALVKPSAEGVAHG